MKRGKLAEGRSSNLAEVGYDEKTETLEVAFHGGRVYQYANVNRAVYEGLMKAHSMGGYLSQIIIKNPVAHPCTRLPDDYAVGVFSAPKPVDAEAGKV